MLLIILLSPGCRSQPKSAVYKQEKGFIKLGDSKIYYERGGGNGNRTDTLILLHAGFLNADMWRAQVPEFARHFQIVAIDIPGHGRTQNDTIRLLPADFIKAVMDSLKISRASLIGVSFGAACATDFVIAHPDRVNKLVLVAAGINGWETRFPRGDTTVRLYLSALLGALANQDSAHAAEVFTQYWFDGPYRTPRQVNDTARRYIYQTTLANIKNHKVRGWPIFAEPPAIEDVSKIKKPVLVIHGDKDMQHINTTSAYLENNIQGAKRIMIPNTGHMLNMEAPAAFNKAVLDFLTDKKQE